MFRSEFIQAAMNVGKWSDREPWLQRLAMVTELHLKQAEETLGMDPERIDEVLGEYRGQLLNAYILEDFCSLKFEGENPNVIDAYLEQHGWRESVRGRRYLEALRNSFASLYEIVKVAPDGAMTVEDRLRDDKPVVLEKGRMLGDLNQGDYIAGRIVAINGDPWLGFPSPPRLLPCSWKLSTGFSRNTQESTPTLRGRARRAKPLKVTGEPCGILCCPLRPPPPCCRGSGCCTPMMRACSWSRILRGKRRGHP